MQGNPLLRLKTVAAEAARAAGVGVADFFPDLDLVLQLAETDLEVAKGVLRKVIEPMVGPAVLRKIEAAASANELRGLAEKFGFASYFEAGRESDDISDGLLAEALSAEAQALLPDEAVLPWLLEDSSGWWRKEENAGHFAEVVGALLEHDQALRSEFVSTLDLEAVFTGMAGEEELLGKLARFSAGLRAGVKGSAVFDGKLLEAFTVEELVRHADADSVWTDFCCDALRSAAESTTSKPAPPTLVTCAACGARAQHGAKHCPDCGQALAA